VIEPPYLEYNYAEWVAVIQQRLSFSDLRYFYLAAGLELEPDSAQHWPLAPCPINFSLLTLAGEALRVDHWALTDLRDLIIVLHAELSRSDPRLGPTCLRPYQAMEVRALLTVSMNSEESLASWKKRRWQCKREIADFPLVLQVLVNVDSWST